MGGQEIAVVALVVVVLLLVVPGRLPRLARNVTDGIREFRHLGDKEDGDDAAGQ